MKPWQVVRYRRYARPHVMSEHRWAITAWFAMVRELLRSPGSTVTLRKRHGY